MLSQRNQPIPDQSRQLGILCVRFPSHQSFGNSKSLIDGEALQCRCQGQKDDTRGIGFRKVLKLGQGCWSFRISSVWFGPKDRVQWPEVEEKSNGPGANVFVGVFQTMMKLLDGQFFILMGFPKILKGAVCTQAERLREW